MFIELNGERRTRRWLPGRAGTEILVHEKWVVWAEPTAQLKNTRNEAVAAWASMGAFYFTK